MNYMTTILDYEFKLDKDGMFIDDSDQLNDLEIMGFTFKVKKKFIIIRRHEEKLCKLYKSNSNCYITNINSMTGLRLHAIGMPMYLHGDGSIDVIPQKEPLSQVVGTIIGRSTVEIDSTLTLNEQGC